MTKPNTKVQTRVLIDPPLAEAEMLPDPTGIGNAISTERSVTDAILTGPRSGRGHDRSALGRRRGHARCRRRDRLGSGVVGDLGGLRREVELRQVEVGPN